MGKGNNQADEVIEEEVGITPLKFLQQGSMVIVTKKRLSQLEVVR